MTINSAVTEDSHVIYIHLDVLCPPTKDQTTVEVYEGVFIDFEDGQPVGVEILKSGTNTVVPIQTLCKTAER